MSARTRQLFRSIRIKEKQKSNSQEKISDNKNKNQSSSLDKRKNDLLMFQSARKPANRNSEGIDPLDYFKSEHIFIQPSNMEEYMVKDKKKEEEEKKKKAEKMSALVGGPTTHKIKFEDMQKMWKKVRKIDSDSKHEMDEKENEDEDNSEKRKANSVETRNIKHDESAENINDTNKNNNMAKSVDKKRYGVQKMGKKTQDEQNMYIKLVLARNRFNKNSLGEQSFYDNIMNLVKQMKSIDNFPEDLSNEIDKLITKLELPDNLIIDSDVQEYYPEDKFKPLISNAPSLDDIIKKYNFTKD